MYYKRNIEALSCNHCCCGKAKVLHILCICSLSYSAHKAHWPYCIAVCGRPDTTTFFHIIT